MQFQIQCKFTRTGDHLNFLQHICDSSKVIYGQSFSKTPRQLKQTFLQFSWLSAPYALKTNKQKSLLVFSWVVVKEINMQTGSPVSWFILLDSNFIPEAVIHFVSAGLDFLSGSRGVIVRRN